MYIQQTTEGGSLAVDTLSEDIFDSALQTRPTIIYLHGNVSQTSLHDWPFTVLGPELRRVFYLYRRLQAEHNHNE